MGILKHSASGRAKVLLARSMVGRGPLCPLRIDDRFASKEHALLWYADGRWWVRDLDSRNGTWLDGKRLQANVEVALARDAELAFGNPEVVWRVADDAAPGPVAEDLLSGEFLTADDGVLALPDEDDPQVVVLADGAGGWLVEQQDAVEAAADQARVEVGGRVFRLLLPTEPTRTWEVRNTLADAGVGLRFRVSADEEHVECTVVGHQRELSLKPRAHMYLMVVLARQRIEDRDGGIAAGEQGWVAVEDLCSMLRLDRKTVNVQIFRARKQFGRAGMGGAAQLFDRRSGSDQIRLGVENVSVGRL